MHAYRQGPITNKPGVKELAVAGREIKRLEKKKG
jgi:hypothetical protein